MFSEGIKKISCRFDCPALEEVVLPESVEFIHLSFAQCKKMSSLTIPKNVREIDYLFGSFKSVAVLSEKIISAAEDALSLKLDGKKCEMKDLLSQNPSYKIIDNFLVNTKTMTILFRIDKTIEVARVPEGIREIGKYAFSEKGVHDRFLPPYKEYESEQLEMIMSTYKTIKDLSCEELEAIRARLPSDIKKHYDYLKNCKWLKCVEFPASVQKVHDAAFEHCDELEKLTFKAKKSDVELSPYAFKNCPVVQVDFADSNPIHNRTRQLQYLRIKRIHQALKKARKGNFPNANKLLAFVQSETGSVSLSTIYRDIEIMKGEFHAPIEYDYSEKGYHYTEDDFELRL